MLINIKWSKTASGFFAERTFAPVWQCWIGREEGDRQSGRITVMLLPLNCKYEVQCYLAGWWLYRYIWSSKIPSLHRHWTFTSCTQKTNASNTGTPFCKSKYFSFPAFAMKNFKHLSKIKLYLLRFFKTLSIFHRILIFHLELGSHNKEDEMINAICLKYTKQCNATNSLWLHFYGMGWREVAAPSQQCGSVTMSATSVLPYKDHSFKNFLKKNGFIKIRLRPEVYANKKHRLTQSAWLSLEHEVLCDSQSRAMASHLHIPICSTMTQTTLQATPYSSRVGSFAFCLLWVL